MELAAQLYVAMQAFFERYADLQRRPLFITGVRFCARPGADRRPACLRALPCHPHQARIVHTRPLYLMSGRGGCAGELRREVRTLHRCAPVGEAALRCGARSSMLIPRRPGSAARCAPAGACMPVRTCAAMRAPNVAYS